MKIIKFHKTHFMATVYNTTSGNMNNIVSKLVILWNKSKLHDANNNTNIKMAMHYDKSNNVRRENKPLKPNVPSVKQPTSYDNTTMNKNRPSDESDKKNPHALRIANK